MRRLFAMVRGMLWDWRYGDGWRGNGWRGIKPVEYIPPPRHNIKLAGGPLAGQITDVQVGVTKIGFPTYTAAGFGQVMYELDADHLSDMPVFRCTHWPIESQSQHFNRPYRDEDEYAA